MEATVAPSPVELSFRSAMRRYASSVTIVTASDHDRRHGMTMTAVSSLSMSPPSMIICVNQSTLLNDILHAGREFCVNVLRHDQADLCSAFSGGVPAHERFTDQHWQNCKDGLPYLRDAQSVIVCKKAAAIPYATHTIFIGTVVDVFLENDVKPLLYRNAAFC
ncbi:flavin reductase family protein [Pseudomonas sp. PAMC 29040]|uniref:flavin reductase family protein n=1 Tax=Pseudomonas sp. PAMC 29040 TaxID=2498450 RepID=UPI001C49811A|nr:flavin reductase family protein [Pseudomonas sp. PAMC 29040]